MVDVVEDGADELADVVVGEGVVDVLAVATCGDDSPVAQGAQSLGDGRLVGAGGGDEFGDAGLALGDQLDEAEPCRIGDGLQQLGGLPHGVGVTAGRTDAVVFVGLSSSEHDMKISWIDEVIR